MKKLLFIVLLLPALAVAETLTWEPPTSRMDGTPLDPATEIAEYRLYCGEVVTVIPGMTVESTYPVDKAAMLPGYGVIDCSLTAVDTEGRESTPSDPVQITWEPANPSAPTQFILIVEGTDV